MRDETTSGRSASSDEQIRKPIEDLAPPAVGVAEAKAVTGGVVFNVPDVTVIPNLFVKKPR